MPVNKESLQVILDELLFFSTSKKFEKDIELAGTFFSSAEVEELKLSTDAGFTDWYMHNYQFENKLYLTDLFRKSKELTIDEKDIIDRVDNSIISIFELQGNGEEVYFKDIFTKADYQIIDKEELEILNAEELHFVRLYPGENGFHLSNDKISCGISFKDILVKTFMARYNEYCKKAGATDIDSYTYENPLIIYKVVHILEDLEAETVYGDEDYSVYQSVYVYKELKSVLEIMDNESRLEKAFEEADSFVYKLYETADQEVIISEIVLCDNRLEAECLSAVDRSKSKAVLEEILNNVVVFLEDQIVGFDDLL